MRLFGLIASHRIKYIRPEPDKEILLIHSQEKNGNGEQS